jgi:glycosyltransferase involved in cell wall biosynthesis
MDNSIILVEPMAHSIGHYLPYALRLALMLKKEYSKVLLVTTEKIEDINVIGILKENNIDYIYTDAQKSLCFKILNTVRKKLPNSLRRIVLFDYLHYKAIKLAYKYDNNNIFFMNTAFYLPFLYLKFNRKCKKIITYRISYPYKYRVFSLLRKVLFNNKNIKLVFQNEKIKLEAREDVNLKYDVIPNLASVDSLYKSKDYINDQKVQYLFFGVNHSGKDWKVFESAINLLNDNYSKKIKLLFVGDIKENDLQCDSPYDLKLDSKVEVEIINTTGRYISSNERDKYFGKSDYIVVSFRKSFQLSSATLIDAISYNRPVVASRNFEITSFVKKYNSGVLFDPSDSESLKNAIEDSIDNKEKYRDIEYNEFLKEHSFSSIAKRVKKIYEKMESEC